jgi:hypothetical protein
MFQFCSCDVPSALCTSSCLDTYLTFPLETLSSRDLIGGVVYLRICFVSRGSISLIYLCFWKVTILESDNVVVFPFAFHITVQQPFKPLWSRLLLYELAPSRASSRYWWRCFWHQFCFLSLSDAYPLTCPARKALPVATLPLV